MGKEKITGKKVEKVINRIAQLGDFF